MSVIKLGSGLGRRWWLGAGVRVVVLGGLYSAGQWSSDLAATRNPDDDGLGIAVVTYAALPVLAHGWGALDAWLVRQGESFTTRWLTTRWLLVGAVLGCLTEVWYGWGGGIDGAAETFIALVGAVVYAAWITGMAAIGAEATRLTRRQPRIHSVDTI